MHRSQKQQKHLMCKKQIIKSTAHDSWRETFQPAMHHIPALHFAFVCLVKVLHAPSHHGQIKCSHDRSSKWEEWLSIMLLSCSCLKRACKCLQTLSMTKPWVLAFEIVLCLSYVCLCTPPHWSKEGQDSNIHTQMIQRPTPVLKHFNLSNTEVNQDNPDNLCCQSNRPPAPAAEKGCCAKASPDAKLK